MIQLKNIHSYYGKSHVLQGIDLNIEKDEIVTLLGRNGAGKTTTIKTIMGLIQPRQGSITYWGESIVGLKPFQVARKGIAYVPEERAIFPHLTVMENLKIAQMAKGMGAKGIWTLERIFHKFPQLDKRKNQAGNSLSGGEQQMLAIARALMAEPDLLLLDEPSEGLAPVIVEELQRIMQEIADHGITLLLVEQNIEMCTILAHRHYVIDQGRIVYHGTNEEFMANDEIKDRYLTLSAVEQTI